MNRQDKLPHPALHVADDALHRTSTVDYESDVESAAPESADKTAEASANAPAIARTNAATSANTNTAAGDRADIMRRLSDGLGAVLGDDGPLDRNRHRHFGHRHFGHVELFQFLS